MDFHQLLAKMQQLDQPVPETQVAEEPITSEECGMMPPSPMEMNKPSEPPPSMSINLNAQGLDNIEELMKLIKAVNPDVEKPMGGMPPSIEIEPMDKPMGGLPPLKMLPDFDAENDGMPGGEPDSVSKAQGDLDNDGDHDMDDHDMEKDGGEEEKEDEAFGNSLGDSEPEIKDVTAAIPDGNDLNKPKTMHKHSYRQGDNPMAMEGEELRSWIKSELQKKLAEAKGVK